MISPLRKLPACLATLCLTALPPWAAASAETTRQDLHQRLAAKAEALVTVQFVLKVQMEGAAERELDGEITCLLIAADGLVLCSNTELGGYVHWMSQLAGGFHASAVPKKIEVVIGDAAAGLAANLLARDSERDLAWLQIDDDSDERQLPFLDFTRHAELAAGQQFYRLRRLDKFFGRAPLVEEGVVGSVTQKPRKLLVPSQPKGGGFGLPVFTAGGELVGVTVLQMPGAEDGAAGLMNGSLPFLSSASGLQDMVGGLILPASEVVKATRLAREIAAEEDE